MNRQISAATVDELAFPIEQSVMSDDTATAVHLIGDRFSEISIELTVPPEHAGQEILSVLPVLFPEEDRLLELANELGRQVQLHPAAHDGVVFKLHIRRVASGAVAPAAVAGTGLTRVAAYSIDEATMLHGNLMPHEIARFHSMNGDALILTAYPTLLEKQDRWDAVEEARILSTQQLRQLQQIQSRMVAEIQAASMQSLEVGSALKGTLASLRASQASVGAMLQGVAVKNAQDTQGKPELLQASQTVRNDSRALAISLKGAAMNAALPPQLRESLRVGLKDIVKTGVLAAKHAPVVTMTPKVTVAATPAVQARQTAQVTPIKAAVAASRIEARPQASAGQVAASVSANVSVKAGASVVSSQAASTVPTITTTPAVATLRVAAAPAQSVPQASTTQTLISSVSTQLKSAAPSAPAVASVSIAASASVSVPVAASVTVASKAAHVATPSASAVENMARQPAQMSAQGQIAPVAEALKASVIPSVAFSISVPSTSAAPTVLPAISVAMEAAKVLVSAPLGEAVRSSVALAPAVAAGPNIAVKPTTAAVPAVATSVATTSQTPYSSTPIASQHTSQQMAVPSTAAKPDSSSVSVAATAPASAASASLPVGGTVQMAASSAPASPAVNTVQGASTVPTASAPVVVVTPGKEPIAPAEAANNAPPATRSVAGVTIDPVKETIVHPVVQTVAAEPDKPTTAELPTRGPVLPSLEVAVAPISESEKKPDGGPTKKFELAKTECTDCKNKEKGCCRPGEALLAMIGDLPPATTGLKSQKIFMMKAASAPALKNG